MTKDNKTHENQANGRIKSSWKLVNPGQEEILLRKGLSNNMNQLCDQRRNMNFKKSEHFVYNKGKKVLMKNVISKKDFRDLKDLGIDKVFLYKEVRTTKILDKMYQHISQKSELSHVDWVIKWKADGHDGNPPNY